MVNLLVRCANQKLKKEISCEAKMTPIALIPLGFDFTLALCLFKGGLDEIVWTAPNLGILWYQKLY